MTYYMQAILTLGTCFAIAAGSSPFTSADDAAGSVKLSTTTTRTTTTTAPMTTLAPQDYCDACGKSIPDGEGVRTPLGLFICPVCNSAGAGGTTVAIGGTATTAVTTMPTTVQTTVPFTSNVYSNEEGILHCEYYAYVGDTIKVVDTLLAYPYELSGDCCTYQDGILTAEKPGYTVLFFYETEAHETVVGEVCVRVVHEPIVTITTATTLHPETNADGSTVISNPNALNGTVTTSPYYPEYNPWVTDAEGNQYYAGTNAYRETLLTMVSKPDRDTFALGEPLDLSGLKVFMTEYRNYNQRDYDVTSVLEIETDYNPDVPGNYTVAVYTNYTCGEARTTARIEWVVCVSEEYIYTTVPDESSSGGTTTLPSAVTTTTTTTTTTTGPESDATGSRTQGDCNGDALVKIDDVVLLCRYVAEDTTIETAAFLADRADHNGDGNVNADDVSSILRYLTKSSA